MTTTRTERLTIPARQLRRADRIVNLTAGRGVTAFDLDLGEHIVDVFPAQADLDAGAARRYSIAAGELVVVDRAVEVDDAPAPAVAETARRVFYVRHVVHVAVAGAEGALCGVRLLGAIDTTAEVTCDRCATHRFETTPGVWSLVKPIGDGQLPDVGGLPESTAGF